MVRRMNCVVMSLVVGVLVGGAAQADDVIAVDVMVSPSTIVLGLEHGAAVTVHTDIALSVVNRDSVALSGVPSVLTKADTQGNLVAKFRQADIEAIVAPPTATLVLTGTTTDGTPFEGEDTVRVINDPPPAQSNVRVMTQQRAVIQQRIQPHDAPPLSAIEVDHILHMREEEKLARDVYLAMDELWDMTVFDNISRSEQRHMDAIKNLIDAYELVDPILDDTPGVFPSAAMGDLYAQLVTQGSTSKLDALMAGAFIEDLDIVDLRVALDDVEHADVQMVFENLENGSCNHLRAFVRLIEALGGTYTPQFLTQDEFDEILATGSNGNMDNPMQIRVQRQLRARLFPGDAQ